MQWTRCGFNLFALWFSQKKPNKNKCKLAFLSYDGAVGRATYYKELKRRLLGCCSVGFLGFDDDLDFVIRQPGLQLFSVLLPLHLAIWSPLLQKKKKRARQGWKKHIYKKKKNIQQTQITSYINSELKIKTMVQDKGCAISRIFPNLSSAINHKKKTSSKPSLWLYPIWSTCLFLHGQSMVMSIICASL